MRLTILGCYGPYPAAGECCSGYLLEENGTSVLLDCGNGVLSRLRYYLQPWELDAVILSHLHSDHISDLMIMRYALAVRKAHYALDALKVYAPAEPAEEFKRLFYKDVLDVLPVSADSELEIGGLKFSFSQGVHAYLSHVITMQSGGKKLVYSGDTEYFEGLVDVVKDADLFLCEANYLSGDIQKGYPNHLAAFQAGKVAQEAGVKRLVLTHHHPEREHSSSMTEAGEYFARVESASVGSVFIL